MSELDPGEVNKDWGQGEGNDSDLAVPPLQPARHSDQGNDGQQGPDHRDQANREIGKTEYCQKRRSGIEGQGAEVVVIEMGVEEARMEGETMADEIH